MPQDPTKSDLSKLSRSMQSSSSVKKVSFDIPGQPEQSHHSRGKSETARRDPPAGLQPSARPAATSTSRSPEKPDSTVKQNSSKKPQTRSSVEKKLVFELSASKENKHRGSIEFYHPSSNNEAAFITDHQNQFETLGGQQTQPDPQTHPKQLSTPKPKPLNPKPKHPERAQPPKKNDSHDPLQPREKDAAPHRKKDAPVPAVEFKPASRPDHSRKKVPATFTKAAPEEAPARPAKSPKPDPGRERPAPKWNGSSKVGLAPASTPREQKPQPLIQESGLSEGPKDASQDRPASRSSRKSPASPGKPRRQSLEEEWAAKKPRPNPRQPPARLDPASLPPGTPSSPEKRIPPAPPLAVLRQAARQPAAGRIPPPPPYHHFLDLSHPVHRIPKPPPLEQLLRGHKPGRASDKKSPRSPDRDSELGGTANLSLFGESVISRMNCSSRTFDESDELLRSIYEFRKTHNLA